MRLLTLPQMRLSQLQTVAETTLTICQSFQELDEPYQKAEQSFELFKKVCKKNLLYLKEKHLIKEEIN